MQGPPLRAMRLFVREESNRDAGLPQHHAPAWHGWRSAGPRWSLWV
jgi:hypothetical protein